MLNVQLENELMALNFEGYKADTQAKFSYIESLLLEKESELREYEERRFMAEEVQVQTEIQGKDIILM